MSNFDEFVFGDTEPEDAWDAHDSVLEQITNLFQRLDVLDGHDPIGRYDALLFEVEQRLRPWRERSAGVGLNERERVRVAQLEEDLAFVRGRIENGD